MFNQLEKYSSFDKTASSVMLQRPLARAENVFDQSHVTAPPHYPNIQWSTDSLTNTCILLSSEPCTWPHLNIFLTITNLHTPSLPLSDGYVHSGERLPAYVTEMEWLEKNRADLFPPTPLILFVEIAMTSGCRFYSFFSPLSSDLSSDH